MLSIIKDTTMRHGLGGMKIIRQRYHNQCHIMVWGEILISAQAVVIFQALADAAAKSINFFKENYHVKSNQR